MLTTKAALQSVQQAVAEGKISPAAAGNIRAWLTEPYLEEYRQQVLDHIAAGKWQELNNFFWTVIPFGTGGRRGPLYPIGCNAINDRTIGESAQGLADYVKAASGNKPLSCAIAYDTRHRSRQFAELCAEIMAAAGFTVYFLDGFRSTPELSFAVRYKHCDCGLIITASHNPPTDNAVKVYGPSGGQLLPPHDAESIGYMQRVTWIRRMPFAEACKAGKVVFCQDEVDKAFAEAVLRQRTAGPRELKIIYSPLHGVGASAVCPVLEADGFTDVELFAPHAQPDPDFSNVPGNSANPENPAVFDIIIQRAQQTGAHLVMATDPDCDRLGCAAPKTLAPGSQWATLTGNQIGSLLTDFLLSQRKAAGTLTPQHFVVKTLVTTELIRRIADHYGVQTVGDLLVGFKYIAREIDARGPEHFVFGAEESYGFLAGDHVRDKDGAVAAMLLAELAARLKAEGRTLHQQLDDLLVRHGCHSESQFSLQMPGEKGMENMANLMAELRNRPPQSMGGLPVAGVRDYLCGTAALSDGSHRPLPGPQGDMLIFDLLPQGNYVAVRPSGTEPKIKFYLFAYDPPADRDHPEAIQASQQQRLQAMEKDLRNIVALHRVI
mgnify:FL=1